MRILTDTDKQNTTGKYTNEIQLGKTNNAKHSRTNYYGAVVSYDTRPGNEVGLFYNAPDPTMALHVRGGEVDRKRVNGSGRGLKVEG